MTANVNFQALTACQKFIEVSQLIESRQCLKKGIPRKVKEICKHYFHHVVFKNLKRMNQESKTFSLIKSSCKIICHKYVSV